MARDEGLDLVQMNDEYPPVCKIFDYNKFKHDQKKKQKQHKVHKSQLKEIKLTPNIGSSDLTVKMNNVVKFLERGDKVKISIVFSGRMITRTEGGQELMNDIITQLEPNYRIESPPSLMGRYLSITVAAKSKK